MPFESQQQARWAFATQQPWAKDWADKTDFAQLPKRVRRKERLYGRNRSVRTLKEVPTAIVTPNLGAASGPGGLFSAAALEKGRYRSKVTEKAEGHTTGMVALYLPAEDATRLAQLGEALLGPQTECADSLHITLAYLGTSEEWGPYIGEIVQAIQEYVQLWVELVGEPLEAVVGELQTFPTIQDDGTIPVYFSIHGEAIHAFVAGLWKTFDGLGIPYHNDFDGYTPHVTIAYAPPNALVPRGAVQPFEIAFPQITICLGDLQIDLPTCHAVEFKAEVGGEGGRATAEGSRARPSAPVTGSAPSQGEAQDSGGLPDGVTRIKGNLCRVHGKFGPCDKASLLPL